MSHHEPSLTTSLCSLPSLLLFHSSLSQGYYVTIPSVAFQQQSYGFA